MGALCGQERQNEALEVQCPNNRHILVPSQCTIQSEQVTQGNSWGF